MKRYSFDRSVVDDSILGMREDPAGGWVSYEEARLDLYLIGYQAATKDFITEDRRLRQVVRDQGEAIVEAREEGRRVGMREAAEIVRLFYESGK